MFDITSLLEFDVDNMMAEFASTSASLDASVNALGVSVVVLRTGVTPLLGL